MPLDALCLAGIIAELRPKIAHAKITKIQQPGRDKILLTLRNAMGTEKLLLAAGTGSGRIQLTSKQYDNPQTPPMFCMLLRKHLSGAKLAELSQPPMERIVQLTFDTYNELGHPSKKTLTLELLGKYCNLVLIDENGRIIDALRRTDGDSAHAVLPGLFYRLPEGQGKQNLLTQTPAGLTVLLDEIPAEKPLDKWLLHTFCGLSPLICRELVHQVFGNTDVHWDPKNTEDHVRFLSTLNHFIERTQYNFTPYQLSDAHGPREFSWMPIHQYGSAYQGAEQPSFSALLDEFYASKDQNAWRQNQAGALQKTVENLRDRLARKIASQQAEVQEAGAREILRIQGDVLMANLHAVQKGQATLTAQNFYDPAGATITIPLDPTKSAQQNAAGLYKKYAKRKTAERILGEQIAKAQEELHYLDSILASFERIDSAGDVAEIRAELTQARLLRGASGKKQKPPPARPIKFMSTTGVPIIAGKNNLQNDALTFRQANRGDIWLHAKHLHGAHVILSCDGEEPDETTLHEAANIAAWHSKGRMGSKIPVDYTRVKHVKKPPGGKPGATHYVNYKTIYVDPDGASVAKLKKE